MYQLKIFESIDTGNPIRDSASLSSPSNRGSNDGTSVQPQRLNQMNFNSEGHSMLPTSMIDRINSASSSNESVCSSSSPNNSNTRQTKSGASLHQQQQLSLSSHLDYNNMPISFDTSQLYSMPKKTQRSKDSPHQRYHPPRENM